MNIRFTPLSRIAPNLGETYHSASRADGEAARALSAVWAALAVGWRSAVRKPLDYRPSLWPAVSPKVKSQHTGARQSGYH